MLRNFWDKLTGKKKSAKEEQAVLPKQDFGRQLKGFKGSKKDLLKMLRNPNIRTRVLDLMQRMSKDGVDTNNSEQIQKWIETHKDELETNVSQVPKTTQVIHASVKISRNDPCLCGSGKKYKRCCLAKGK